MTTNDSQSLPHQLPTNSPLLRLVECAEEIAPNWRASASPSYQVVIGWAGKKVEFEIYFQLFSCAGFAVECSIYFDNQNSSLL